MDDPQFSYGSTRLRYMRVGRGKVGRLSFIGAAFLTITALNLFFTNCHSSVRLAFFESTSRATQKEKSVSNRDIPVSAFAGGKVQLNGRPASGGLVALVNTACARAAADQGTMSGQMMAETTIDAGMDTQAVAFQPSAEMTSEQLSAAAEADPCLLGIAPNDRLHANFESAEPDLAQQRQMPSIRATQGWDFFYSSSKAIKTDVIIAIVDTGVDYTHQDLTGRMWTNALGKFGQDFVNNDDDPLDDNMHGTHVAGLAAAQGDNRIGGSGVMLKNAKIMAVKVLDAQGAGTIAAIVNGIRYAADNGAHLINMSLGGPGANALLQDALTYAVGKGSTVIVAAGNDNVQLTAAAFYSPSSYAATINGVICIGSVDAATGARSFFSNFGPTFVDLGAPGSGPGGGVYSTLPNNTYGLLQGTSMATPVTIGAAALIIGILRSNAIDATPAVVEETLLAGTLQKPALATAFKDGRILDLPTLATYMQSRFFADGAGGIRTD